jgi:hypothetical protein
MLISSVNLIAAMLLTAFVIERAIAAGAFIGSLFTALIKGNKAARNELLSTFGRTLVAGLLAAAVINMFDWMRLLSTFGVTDYRYGTADKLLTWLVLVSGTDRLSTFVGAGADADSRAKKTALDLNGTVAIDDAGAKAVRDRAQE